MEKISDWGIKVPSNKYFWGYNIKYTLKHKIRLFIWVTWSTELYNKKYYFFGIKCSNKDFYLWKHKYQFLLSKYHKLLQKLTPIINKILWY